ncbi:Monooxygenase [Cordyceps militaris CM01]|uniref:Monooxygenase n=1 Tax=Cordyceps militaris (strain CM01) TaxID=983644 RepID=G3JNW2_CORMM|nr:Monooxygenase [Cordyceps militaris CM01]EGX89572.1 Monooxygenase [Cordyceps militaris CM01]
MDGTILPTLPELKLHVAKEDVDATAIVSQWLVGLQACLDGGSLNKLGKLFNQDSWWRDILALDWDFTTKQGQDKIGSYLDAKKVTITDLKLCESGGLKPALVEWAGQAWVQSAFTFCTQHGQCRGYVRLENDAASQWKAWTVFTELEELRYQQDLEAQRRLSRAAQMMPQTNGTHSSEDIDVLIVGAGQAGVSLGARLKHMGIRARLVERHPAVGDAWRARYDSVTLNTPTFTDHYPFMKYPESWPEWLTGKQAADFLEHYAQLMGLDILLGATVRSVERIGDKYSVVVVDGAHGEQTFSPRHVVLATGVYGDTPITPQFPGQDTFAGTMYHSSERASARLIPELSEKNVVVIGCSTSGHDVCQDFVDHGARQVTMVQRHAIFALSTDTWKTLQLGLWNMPGLSTEEADLVGNSLPVAVVRAMSVDLTRAMAALDDAPLLDGLRRAGMALRTGEDGYGLADHQLIKGGCYYIDQGAGAMIADGRIRVRRCEAGVARMTETAVVLADGTSIEADVVVLATGFEKNVENVRRVMGDDVADKMVGFGDLDAEQERVGWWRPTGLDGFWYMTGSFMWCRQFSRALALQIAGQVKGYY